VATTLGLASRKVTLEKSCNMSGSVKVTKGKSEHDKRKGRPVSLPPLEPLIFRSLELRRFGQGPGGLQI